MKNRLLFWLATLLTLVAVGRGSAQDCYESNILSPAPFLGNDGEIFKLADGSFWEVKYEYAYLYLYYPSVTICPSQGKMIVGNKSLNVQRVDCYESNILSPAPFLGNDGEIFKLADGSFWEVKYEYAYLYLYYPAVIIWPSQGKLIVGNRSLNVQLVSGPTEPPGLALMIVGGTGGGKYAAGTTVAVAADTPPTGKAFARWTVSPADAYLGAGFSVEQASTTVTMPWRDVTLTAVFDANTYTVSFDAQGGTVGPSSKLVTYGAAYGTLPVSARAGFLFAGWWTGAGGTGTRVTESSVVTVAATQTLYAKWQEILKIEWLAMVGVSFAVPLPDMFAGATKVVVKGLPAGLKYNSATATIAGVPTKAGMFSGEISATGVTSQTVTITVVALPAWAQGSFNGYVEDGGPATMTVAAAGKVTGKIAVAGTNYTFSAASYKAGGSAETGFEMTTEAKAGKTALPMTLTVTQGIVTGTLGGGLPVTLYRDVWKTETAALTPYIGYYTATLPGNDECGSGYLTLSVDKNGGVKTVGKLGDGTAVSLSGTLILDPTGCVFTVVYAAPAAYKGGGIFGLSEFVELAGVGAKVILRPLDGGSFLWRNLNPQATQVYGAGFDRELGLAGGWYSKADNLYGYYAGKNLSVGADTNTPLPELTVGTVRYDSVCWNPSGVALTPTFKSGVMTGLSAPAAGKPVDPDKNGVWDYSATNSVGLKVSLARPTGVFKGSFNAWFDYPEKKHVSKTLAFEGALTPEREDKTDGVEGCGFFLWPDKGTIPAIGKAYPFSWSYDFKILMTE